MDSCRTEDADFINALVKIMDSSELGEIEFSRKYSDGGSIRIKIASLRGMELKGQRIEYATHLPQVYNSDSGINGMSLDNDCADNAKTEAADDFHHGSVFSPMVGTVYLSPDPDSPRFVSVGDYVNKGDTLLIVEAMKTMNYIPSPFDGRVQKVLVDNLQPVEFHTPLVIIE